METRINNRSLERWGKIRDNNAEWGEGERKGLREE